MDEVSSIDSEEQDIDFATVSVTTMGTTSVKYSSDPCTILGNGLKAIVYPGYHFGIGKPVAVKFIKKRYLKRVENEQINELKIWSKIDQNINIVRLFDSYQDPKNGLFLAMEKAERTFKKQITKYDTKENEVINWLYQVAQGVKYLHGKGIIHRDIKPDNILMILQDGNKLVAKLADFGVSKMLSVLEKTGTFSNANGTLLWMAPEALENRNQRFKNTRALDIFALGMTMYFGLTKGGHPFTQFGNEDFLTTVLPRMTNKSAKPFSLSLNQFAADELLFNMMLRQPNNRPDITQVVSHCLFWSREKEHLFLIRAAICLSKQDCVETYIIKKEIDELYTIFFEEIYPFKNFNWINIAKEKNFDIPGLMFITRKRKNPTTEYGDGESVTKFMKLFRDKYVHYPEMNPEGIKWFSDNDGVFCEKVYVKTLTAICPGLTSVLYKILLQNSDKVSLLPITKLYFPWKIPKSSKSVVKVDKTAQGLPLPWSFLPQSMFSPSRYRDPPDRFLAQLPYSSQHAHSPQETFYLQHGSTSRRPFSSQHPPPLNGYFSPYVYSCVSPSRPWYFPPAEYENIAYQSNYSPVASNRVV